ncbi:hypothetical protein D9613_001273 [Agrocybe pediades]|uniref:Uncharacterized protein n=1 Tax=Agrocybe pediades TaxID=84607 RepID=A0A8H4R691_9AGAR|nr:hypothetical protein D9613_001273 [Agrocybe pediades]
MQVYLPLLLPTPGLRIATDQSKVHDINVLLIDLDHYCQLWARPRIQTPPWSIIYYAEEGLPQTAEGKSPKKFIASAGTYANLVRQARSKQKIMDKMEAAGLDDKVETGIQSRQAPTASQSSVKVNARTSGPYERPFFLHPAGFLNDLHQSLTVLQSSAMEMDEQAGDGGILELCERKLALNHSPALSHTTTKNHVRHQHRIDGVGRKGIATRHAPTSKQYEDAVVGNCVGKAHLVKATSPFEVPPSD